MKSIREIYKIGKGPSSSHTMGPERAALLFRNRYPDANQFTVTLYGSLNKTGVGHGTDRVLLDTLGENRTKIVFSREEWEGMHPNTMDFSAFVDDIEIGHLRVNPLAAATSALPVTVPKRIPRKYTLSIPLRKFWTSANGATSTPCPSTWN